MTEKIMTREESPPMTHDPGLALAISPCPNDTFMFYHFIEQSRLSKALRTSFCDIEQLNQQVLHSEPDIAKCSFSLASRCLGEYALLDCGAALGRGCGPLLVSREKMSLQDLPGKKILIPGANTTAFMLAKFFIGGECDFQPCLFSEIMPAIAAGEADAGLIIHESRFTYPNHGLQLIADVGDLWEKETQLQIPLGAILVRRSLGEERIGEIQQQLRASVQWAQSQNWRENKSFADFIHQHAQEFDAQVLDSHIATYVNEESVRLSANARQSVMEFFRRVRLVDCLPELHERDVFA